MTNSNCNLIEVAVNAPLFDRLTYLQNPDFTVKRGDTVDVPLGKRKVSGVVITDTLADKVQSKKFELKSILKKNELFPKLNDPFLKWLEWVADYYLHPLGQVIQLCYPPLEKKRTNRISNRTAVIPI